MPKLVLLLLSVCVVFFFIPTASLARSCNWIIQDPNWIISVWMNSTGYSKRQLHQGRSEFNCRVIDNDTEIDPQSKARQSSHLHRSLKIEFLVGYGLDVVRLAEGA